jgi:hypothetical protein
MEQGRAPPLLVHLTQLARSAAALIRHRDQPDQQHDQSRRLGGTRSTGRAYPIGKKVSAKELREFNIEQADFHGDWNYVVRPRPKLTG